MSPATRGRELKHEVVRVVEVDEVSPATRGRELKQHDGGRPARGLRVARHARA